MINSLYKFFYNLQNTLPLVTALLVFMAIVLLLIIMFLVVQAVRKSSRKKPPPKPQPLSTAAKEETEKKKSVFALEEDSIFYRYSWSAKLLSRIGFYPKGKIASSFMRTSQLLRDQVGGNDYLYKLPWFLMVGPSESGKSSILKYTDLPQPVGKPQFYPQGEKPGCDWSFFEDSVVLDIRGDYFLDKKEPNSDKQWWNHLVTLLCRFRPKRPIDGIILAIPSSELVGDKKIDADHLAKRAEHIQKNLAVLSIRTGMRLPLYIVITKSDHIPGFKSISNEIPDELNQDIFGWSSPYPVEERYTSSWMDDAFSDIQDALGYIQNEIFSKGKLSDEADGVFLFPSSMQKVKNSLQIFTDNIFRENGFNKFYFLRGVYFCGDAEIDISAEKISGLSTDFGSNVPRLGSQKSGDALIGDEYKRQPHILFTRRLLGEKIFQEFGLARPDARRLASINTHVRILKYALVATVLIGIYGINKSHDRIQELSGNILPVANGLNNSLIRLERISEMPNVSVDANFFDQQSRRLFSMIDLLTESSLRTVFLPASWFGGLESRADRLIQFSYESLFLRSIYYKIHDKIYAKIEDPTANVAYQEKNVIYTPPTKTKEFIQLKHFVDSMAKLETAARRFNDLKTSRNLDNLSDVVRTTFGVSILSKLKKHSRVHQTALGKATYPDIFINKYKDSSTKQLNELYDRFVDRVLDSETTFKGIRSLESMIELFVESRYKNIPSLSHLRAIAQGVNNTVSLIQTPGLNWIENKVFNPDNTFIGLMASIESSDLFGTDVVTDLYQKTDRQFEKLKAELRDFESPLTGPLFSRSKGQIISEASTGLQSLKKNLNYYLKQSFLGSVKKYDFTDRIPEGRTLFWNRKNIEKAIRISDGFVRFTSEGLPRYPADLQHILKLMAREQLHKSVMSLVGQAQTFVDRPVGSSRTVSETVMRSQVRNLKNVTPQFIQLLRSLEKSGNIHAYIAIRDILLNQIFDILQVADNVLESENLYAIKDESFDWWEGETGLAYAAFNAQDKQSLKNYLDSQRDRVFYLANNFVRPVMTLFGNDIFRLGSIEAPLLDKWIRILRTSNEYQQKKPNTPITKIEKFLGEQLNTVGWNNCVKTLYQAESKGDGDFFIGKLNAVRTAAFDRCRVLLGEKTYEQYSQLRAFFERNLEGRFPFVKDPSSFSYSEASINDVRAFFKMFNAYKESTRQILAQSGEFGTPGAEALQFIDDMYSVEQFLRPFLENLEGTDTPGYDFNVEFRVLREAEQGGNKIADWTLFSGAKAVNFRDDVKTGRWEFGAPVAIQLRWAKDTAVRPVSDPIQKSLNVSETIATFGYTGQWAMLRLFLNHATSSSDMVVAKDPRPEVLTFSVPVRSMNSYKMSAKLPEAQTRRSKVFIRVIPTVKASDGAVNTVVIPTFPSMAPDLPKPVTPSLVYFSDLLSGKSMPLDGSLGAGKVGAPTSLNSASRLTNSGSGNPNTFSANINKLTSSLKK